MYVYMCACEEEGERDEVEIINRSKIIEEIEKVVRGLAFKKS